MTTREKIPHTARFLMTFHTAGGRAAAQTAPEAPVSDPFATAASSTPAQPEDTRSSAQTALMEKLITSLQALDATLGQQAREYTDRMTAHGAWTRGREGNASRWIGNMISKERELRAAQQAAPAAQQELEDGMYELDGKVYKVLHAVHGSGRQYAKLLDGNGFTMAPGVVRQLRPEHKMTLEQAKEYGRIYGVCCRCAAPLTDEASIAAGIGPVCAGKF